MSNLGKYQWITTTAKKVGGPVQLLVYTALVGYAGIRVIEAGGKKIYKVVRKEGQTDTPLKKYTVTHNGESNEGVAFKTDEEVIVLERDGDVILVHKIGDPDSPYYISEEFLSSISEYKAE